MGSGLKSVLITGISQPIGRLLTYRLMRSNDVCGVDRSPWRRAPLGVEVFPADLRKRAFEDVLRTRRPDAVVHLGLTRDFSEPLSRRYERNVRGTRRVLDLCHRYDVGALVVLSSGYVYGAQPENPYRLDEDAPLLGSRSYPQIGDLVEVDAMATAFLWQHASTRTTVLRPVNVLGPTARSTASVYLRQSRVPTVMGFDPMMQFIHEDDVARAIELALVQPVRGVYNVVGPGEVPVSVAIRECGGRAVPLPEPLLRPTFRTLFRWHVAGFPSGMIDHLKYPVTLAGRRFAREAGFGAEHGLRETFEGFRRARRLYVEAGGLRRVG